LADPGPIVHTFKTSELAERLRLDGIITIVDARHLEKELNDGPEPAAQIAFADVILLNKIDLVSAENAGRIERRIRKMNALADIHRTTNSQIDPAKIFNINARELSGPFALPAAGARGPELDPASDSRVEHDHGNREEEHAEQEHPHHHDESVSSCHFTEERPLDLKRVEAWLTEVIRELGPRIYRSKGVLQIQGQAKRVIFQGVQTMFDARPDRLWQMAEKRMSRLVFIGKDLDGEKLRQGFLDCVAKQ
jgi:G3E family GTPase